jgi:hypothetical protein
MSIWGKPQPLAPSQADLHTPSPSPHSLCGSVPAAKGAHVPSWPAWLQAMQVPPQARSQHTPSAQKPEAHALALVHG